MESDGTDRHTGLVKSTLHPEQDTPIDLTSAGESEYQQFDWWDEQYHVFDRRDKELDWVRDFHPSEFDENREFHFTVHWTATMEVPDTDEYTFATASDDESWVFVDEQLVVDNGGLHGRTKRTSSMSLEAGTHRIDIFFAERHRTGSNFTFEAPDEVTFIAEPRDGRVGTNFASFVNQKRALIQEIRSVADTEPYEVPEVEKTEHVPNNGETITGFLEGRASTIDSSPEQLVDEYESNFQSGSTSEREQFTEAVHRLRELEKLTRTTAIQGATIARRTGKLGTTALIAAAFHGAGKLGGKGFGELFETVVDYLSLLFNGVFQDLIEALGRMFDRLETLLLPDLNGSQRSTAENNFEKFNEEFSLDRLEGIGENILEGVQEAANENNWNLHPNNVLDVEGSNVFDIQLTDVGEGTLLAGKEAMQDADGDPLTDFTDLITGLGEALAGPLYREFMLENPNTTIERAGDGNTENPRFSPPMSKQIHGLEAALDELSGLVDDRQAYNAFTDDRDGPEALSGGTRTAVQMQADSAHAMLDVFAGFTKALELIELVLLTMALLVEFAALIVSLTGVGGIVGVAAQVPTATILAAAGLVALIYTGVSAVGAFTGKQALNRFMKIHAGSGYTVVSGVGGSDGYV